MLEGHKSIFGKNEKSKNDASLSPLKVISPSDILKKKVKIGGNRLVVISPKSKNVEPKNVEM